MSIHCIHKFTKLFGSPRDCLLSVIQCDPCLLTSGTGTPWLGCKKFEKEAIFHLAMIRAMADTMCSTKSLCVAQEAIRQSGELTGELIRLPMIKATMVR